jgi:hypothetical protein
MEGSSYRLRQGLPYSYVPTRKRARRWASSRWVPVRTNTLRLVQSPLHFAG